MASNNSVNERTSCNLLSDHHRRPPLQQSGTPTLPPRSTNVVLGSDDMGQSPSLMHLLLLPVHSPLPALTLPPRSMWWSSSSSNHTNVDTIRTSSSSSSSFSTTTAQIPPLQPQLQQHRDRSATLQAILEEAMDLLFADVEPMLMSEQELFGDDDEVDLDGANQNDDDTDNNDLEHIWNGQVQQ